MFDLVRDRELNDGLMGLGVYWYAIGFLEYVKTPVIRLAQSER